MRSTLVPALRVVIAGAIAGSLVVQLVMLPLLWVDLDGAPPAVRIALVTLSALGIGCLQVVAVCIWRLLTLVHRRTVFSPAAFRYVDVVIVAILTGAGLMFGVAVALAPGEAVAPGVVALTCGAAFVIGGVALVVAVLRMLLAQAVDLTVRNRGLQAELDQVI